MFNLYHVGYCGMASVSKKFDDAVDARKAAADFLKRQRRLGRKVVGIAQEENDDTQRWEILEPEDSCMVPDWAGFLVLRHVTFECRECGCGCETKQAALECCQYACELSGIDND